MLFRFDKDVRERAKAQGKYLLGLSLQDGIDYQTLVTPNANAEKDKSGMSESTAWKLIHFMIRLNKGEDAEEAFHEVFMGGGV